MISGGKDPFDACKGLSGADAQYCRWLIEQCEDEKQAQGERGPGAGADQYRLVTCDGQDLILSSHNECIGMAQIYAYHSSKCPTVWGAVPITFQDAQKLVKGKAMVMVANPADPELSDGVSELRRLNRDHKLFFLDSTDLGTYAALDQLKIDQRMAEAIMRRGKLAVLEFEEGRFKRRVVPGLISISYEDAAKRVRGKAMVIVANPADPELATRVRKIRRQKRFTDYELFLLDSTDLGTYAALDMLKVDQDQAERTMRHSRFAGLEFKKGSFVGEAGPYGFLKLTRDNVERVEQEIEARGYPFMVVVGKEDSLHCSQFKDDLLRAQRSGDWTYHRLVYVDMADRDLGVDLLRQLKILDHAAEYKRIPQAYVFKGQLKTEAPRDGMSDYMESLKNRIGTIIWEAEKREVEQETKVLAAEMEGIRKELEQGRKEWQAVDKARKAKAKKAREKQLLAMAMKAKSAEEKRKIQEGEKRKAEELAKKKAIEEEKIRKAKLTKTREERLLAFAQKVQAKEGQRRAAEEAKRKAQELAKKKAQEEEKIRKAQEEEKLREAEEARESRLLAFAQKAQVKEEQRRAAEEAKKKAVELAKKKAQEEERARKIAEEKKAREAREEEEARKAKLRKAKGERLLAFAQKAQAKEERRRAAEEAKRKAQELAKKKVQEEEKIRKAQEEEKLREAEELRESRLLAIAQKAQAAEEQRRAAEAMRKARELARKKAQEEEKARKIAEERRRAEQKRGMKACKMARRTLQSTIPMGPFFLSPGGLPSFNAFAVHNFVFLSLAPDLAAKISEEMHRKVQHVIQ